MRIFKAIKRLLILAALCVCCALIMAVLPFKDRDRGAESGSDSDEETIVGWMIDRIAGGEIDLSDADSIMRAIGEGEEKYDIALSEENKERIAAFLQTLDTVGEDAGDFIERAKQKYRTYSEEFIGEADEAVNGAVKNAVKNAADSFFQSLIP